MWPIVGFLFWKKNVLLTHVSLNRREHIFFIVLIVVSRVVLFFSVFQGQVGEKIVPYFFRQRFQPYSSRL